MFAEEYIVEQKDGKLKLERTNFTELFLMIVTIR
jgi:hypothetical protein